MTRQISKAEFKARQAAAAAAAAAPAPAPSCSPAPSAPAPAPAVEPPMIAASPQAPAPAPAPSMVPAPPVDPAAVAFPRGPLLPGEVRHEATPLPMVDNPPPDSRSPGEWVISEAIAIRALVRHYGWRVMDIGYLRRCVKPTPAPVPLRLVGDDDAAFIELADPVGSMEDLTAAAVRAVA